MERESRDSMLTAQFDDDDDDDDDIKKWIFPAYNKSKNIYIHLNHIPTLEFMYFWKIYLLDVVGFIIRDIFSPLAVSGFFLLHTSKLKYDAKKTQNPQWIKDILLGYHSFLK